MSKYLFSEDYKELCCESKEDFLQAEVEDERREHLESLPMLDLFDYFGSLNIGIVRDFMIETIIEGGLDLE